MPTTIRTSEGQHLDTICQAHYGRVTGTVETVLDANPGLGAVAQPYPAGVIIILPEVEAGAPAGVVRLWD
jgi:phage tail protein X